MTATQAFSRDAVTRRMAEDWLAEQACNRSVSKSHYETMGRDMAEGRWVENGAPLIFGVSGRLIDGQHRLLAFLYSGLQSMYFDIRRNISTDGAKMIDRGERGRTLRDFLALFMDELELPPATQASIAPSLRLLWLYRLSGNQAIRFTARSRPSDFELIDLLRAEPLLSLSLPWRNVGEKLGLHAAWPFAHYIFAQKDREDADSAFDILRSGSCIEADHPILRFREQHIEHRARNRKQPVELVMPRLFRAWRHFRAGTRPANIQQGRDPYQLGEVT